MRNTCWIIYSLYYLKQFYHIPAISSVLYSSNLRFRQGERVPVFNTLGRCEPPKLKTTKFDSQEIPLSYTYGVDILKDGYFVLTQCTRLTERRTDRHTDRYVPSRTRRDTVRRAR